MPRKLFLSLIVTLAALAGCDSDAAQGRLAEAVRQLQRNLDTRATAAVADQLHTDFRAQGRYDRDWAVRTLAQLHAEPRPVRFITLGKTSRIDRVYTERGRTQLEVAMRGDLMPERSRPYSVRLEWWQDGETWKLARLDWQ
ncbi:MAG: hypothetical protein GAK45_00586 [Pseudomonas citronellolis]|nr:MAG: hypothetical protein GAK45_00586 [Pseudomonas citronellolis]